MDNNIVIWKQRSRRTSGVLFIHKNKSPHLLKGVYFKIAVNVYNIVTPFGQE